MESTTKENCSENKPVPKKKNSVKKWIEEKKSIINIKHHDDGRWRQSGNIASRQFSSFLLCCRCLELPNLFSDDKIHFSLRHFFRFFTIGYSCFDFHLCYVK